MKKIIATILMLSMVLSVTACSPSNESNQTASSGAQTTSEVGAQDVDWPKRGIELIVPLSAGGDTDFYARTYARYLEKVLGTTVTVINVEGAGGTIGAQQVATGSNDGNTILFYHTGNMFTNKLLGTTELDNNDFEIAAVAVLDDTNILVASKESGIVDGEDFLAKVRAEPNKYNIATTISGFSYFVCCKAEKAGDFQLNPVDVGSASAMIPSILGNQTELAANSYGLFKQYIESGDVIPLMVFSEERNPNFPDVPTAKEFGMEDSVVERAYFFAFPKGTDEAIVKKLSDAVETVQTDKDFASDLRNAYMVEPFFKNNVVSQEYLNGIWDDMAMYEAELKN